MATLVGMTILSAMEDLLNAVRHYHANGDKVRSMQDLCDKWERLNTAMGGRVTAVYGSGLPHAGHCYGLILAAQTLEQAGNDAEAVWQSAAEACLASVS